MFITTDDDTAPPPVCYLFFTSQLGVSRTRNRSSRDNSYRACNKTCVYMYASRVFGEKLRSGELEEK